MNDIRSELVTGIYNVLNGNVTISGVTYPVYKTVYSGQTNRAYVHIGNVIDRESGTKSDFIYEGSIFIEVIDERQTGNVDRSIIHSVSNKVRDLLKTTKTEVPTVTGYTCVILRHGGGTTREDTAADGRKRYVITDIYEFLIN